MVVKEHRAEKLRPIWEPERGRAERKQRKRKRGTRIEEDAVIIPIYCGMRDRERDKEKEMKK